MPRVSALFLAGCSVLALPGGGVRLPGPRMSRPGRGASVQVTGVTVSHRSLWRRKAVLHDVSLSIDSGRLVAVVGPNGAGKTTLFTVLMGFHGPDGGRCDIDGMQPAVYRRTRGIGYVAEESRLPSGWTVRQFLRRAVDLSPTAVDGEAEYRRAIARTRLERDALSQPLSSCSKGTRRRIAFAWAGVGDPQLYVLDEPFSGLDPASRAYLREELQQLRDSGRTVLMASHEVAEVGRLADVALIIHGGRLRRAEHTGSDSQALAAALEAELLRAEASDDGR